jgi:hypothetical protein
MRRALKALCVLAVATLTACGGVTSLPPPAPSARQVLAGSAALLDFESAATRQELFRDLARTSLLEAGRNVPDALFPLKDGSRRVAAPGIELGTDLLQTPDAGQVLQLTFGGRGSERWPEDRRDSLQGLSEREAVELVARTLIARWGLQPSGPVQVDRASGAQYAAAYVDGLLSVNPAFLYLAVSPTTLAASNP